MPNQNLGELVSLTQDEANLIVKVTKTTTPVKPFALRELPAKLKDGTSQFEVPKSETFAYFAKDLADGSILTVTRYRPVAFAKRQKLYEIGTAAGLNVIPPTEGKQRKAKPAALTLEELERVAASAKPKTAKVNNPL